MNTKKIKTANYTAPAVSGSAEIDALEEQIKIQDAKIITQSELITSLNNQIEVLQTQNAELAKENEDLRQQIVAPQVPASTTASAKTTNKNGFLLTAGLAIAALVIINQ